MLQGWFNPSQFPPFHDFPFVCFRLRVYTILYKILHVAFGKYNDFETYDVFFLLFVVTTLIKVHIHAWSVWNFLSFVPVTFLTISRRWCSWYLLAECHSACADTTLQTVYTGSELFRYVTICYSDSLREVVMRQLLPAADAVRSADSHYLTKFSL